MQGLMYRLAELDADSAGLVRVIDYFDALLRHGADVTELLRASAVLADCVVGLKANGLVTRRCSPKGEWHCAATESATIIERAVVVDEHTIGAVWLERASEPLPLDEMLIDRLALTAATIIAPRRAPTDVDASERLLSAHDRHDAIDACSALGIDPTSSARVVSLTAATMSDATAIASRLAQLSSPGRTTPVPTGDDVLVIVTELAAARTELARTGAVSAGISLAGPLSEIHQRVSTARLARVHLADGGRPAMADDLGALNILATAPPDFVNSIPDVRRCAAVRKTKHGADLLATLRVYLRVGTLRDTAVQMHLHHSSVATRLKSFSATVQFAVTAPENRARATAMLLIDELAATR